MLTATRPSATERASPERRRMTPDEFFAMPEAPPRYELEDGELIVTAQPHSRHQRVLLYLGAFLLEHIRLKQAGSLWPEIDVQLPGRTSVYVPDLVFLTSEHLDRHSEAAGRITGVLDLVVEIVSPSTERRDRTTKFRAYQQAGVAWYWLVRPDDLWIEEYRLTPEGYVLAQSVPPGETFAPGLFPGLTVDLATLMGEPTKGESESDS